MAEEDGPNTSKQQMQDLLKELDLPFALFLSGAWHEYISFLLGCNFEEGVMKVVGEGDVKMSMVERTDLSRFIAHVLLTAPKSSLEWSRFSVESNRLSPKEIAALPEKKFGKKIEIKSTDYEVAKAKYETDPMSYFSTRIADGRYVSGTEEEAKETVANFFPDWNPTSYEEFLK